jgi:hypothetical protein
LEYRDKPGDKTREHRHPDFALYSFTAFKRRLTLGGGRTLERSFGSGQTAFSEAQTHIGANTGETETHVLLVELKEPRGGNSAQRDEHRPSNK